LSEGWYVLACTPRKERVIYHQLRDRGFDVYYPYIVVRTQNPNTLKIEPYFPGYMFIRVDLSKIALTTFQWMPMTEGLVCVADTPAFIPDRIVHAIHRNLWRMNSAILGTPEQLNEEDQSATDEVIVPADGSLFDQKLSGRERANALLQMLQGSSLAAN
jgi:transcription antitermination factor NusG